MKTTTRILTAGALAALTTVAMPALAIDAEDIQHTVIHYEEGKHTGLAVADGGLGFWAALPKVFPTTREQRCWVHKTANVLDKMPKSSQGKAKKMLHDIYLAETKDAAEKAFDEFLGQYRVKLPKAVECLEKDRAVLLAFYDFPAEHWAHLRTTNPIESTFASVRLRHRRTKGCGSREASLTMVLMLARQAERHWRRLKGAHMILHIMEGRRFKDGILVTENAA